MSSVAEFFVWLPIFILGSVWYLAITWLLFLIWRELGWSG